MVLDVVTGVDDGDCSYRSESNEASSDAPFRHLFLSAVLALVCLRCHHREDGQTATFSGERAFIVTIFTNMHNRFLYHEVQLEHLIYLLDTEHEFKVSAQGVGQLQSYLLPCLLRLLRSTTFIIHFD